MRYFQDSDLGAAVTPEEMKAKLLDMLLVFDRFCEENGLRYYLSGGTLLGAIRHHGFIPWDDDIDVNMPRPDTDKLWELTHGKLGGYTLLPPNFTTYRHAYHYKLYDTTMLVKKRRNLAPYPIFLDIFPIEGLPDTEEGNIEHYKEIAKWKNLAGKIWREPRDFGKNLPKRIAYYLRSLPAKRYGREELFNRVTGVMRSIPFDSAEYVGVMATKVHTTEERVKKSEFCSAIKVDFEGHKLNGPAGYDAYLRQLFGENYMELPPVEMRKSHHLKPYMAKEGLADSAATIGMLGLIKSENLGEIFIAKSL